MTTQLTAPPSRTMGRRAAKNALWAAAGVLVFALIVLAVVARVESYHVTRVLSNSMHPTFSVGDYVLVQDRPVVTLAPGEVVVLPEPGTDVFYIHRLQSVTHPAGGTRVTTKGDNNPVPDTWTLDVTSATVPVYVAHLSAHGVVLPTTRPGTAQLLLGGALVLLAGSLVRPRRRERRDGAGSE